ncbi:MAG: long-chain N-acyl amino acid synthase [Burkholderiales bacterium]|nr:long-chain N-acyl amino acid synthase [Burkholderiales bacterium]
MNNPESPADRWSQTIIGLPLDEAQPLREVSLARTDLRTTNISLAEQQFKVRLANSEGRRESASLLIKKLYAWRGYDISGMDLDRPNRITLMADALGQPIGTITIGLDSPSGLLVDSLYHDEIEQLRQAGCSVCEFTKLAIDQDIKSKRVLASLFHLACIFAHRIHGATDITIEINPRHAPFYRRMLGFTLLGEERLCPRVQAPAVLLRLTFAYLNEQVEKYGGTFQDIPGVRSFYPFFFSKQDEDGIAERLERSE